MSGCLGRLGCLIVLVALLAVGWLTRDRWLSKIPGTHVTVASTTAGWEPVTDAGADRVRKAFARLESPRGPVFVTLTPGDVASYVFALVRKDSAVHVDSIAAKGVGDRLSVRANVGLGALKDRSALGPLAALLGDREAVELTGTLHMVKPGLAELRVQELKIRDLVMPRALIPRLLRQLLPGQTVPGVAPDGLPFAIPAEMGDIRVSNGKIILYKTTH